MSDQNPCPRCGDPRGEDQPWPLRDGPNRHTELVSDLRGMCPCRTEADTACKLTCACLRSGSRWGSGYPASKTTACLHPIHAFEERLTVEELVREVQAAIESLGNSVEHGNAGGWEVALAQRRFDALAARVRELESLVVESPRSAAEREDDELMAAKLRRELFEAGIDSGQEDDTAKEIAVMVAMEAFRRLKRELDEARGERDDYRRACDGLDAYQAENARLRTLILHHHEAGTAIEWGQECKVCAKDAALREGREGKG